MLPTLDEENGDVETSMTEPKDGHSNRIEPQKQRLSDQSDQNGQKEQLPNHPADLDSREKSTDDHEVITTSEGQKSRQPKPRQDPGFEVQTWILLHDMLWCDQEYNIIIGREREYQGILLCIHLYRLNL